MLIKHVMPFNREEIERSIPARFARVVDQFPDQIAVKVSNQTLTYKELDTRSNRVARAILSRQNVDAEAPIVLLFDHHIAQIVAILGVLKAGKFYVALNPLSPYARLTGILEDTHTNLIVTNYQNRALATELAQNRYQVLNLDDLESSLSDDKVNVSRSLDSLAALFYTSGSTGAPKGVKWNYRHVLQNAWRYTHDFHISPEDHHSFLFLYDLSPSLTSIVGVLLNGATLYPYDVRQDGLSQLVQWLIQEEITIFRPPVMLFRQLLDILSHKGTFPTLRVIILGGQPVYPHDVEQFRTYFPKDCLLVNNLGSTEVGAYAQFFINHQTKISGNRVPVGYAVEDKEILLLDETGHNVGFNEVGEIAVRSRYLSPGYWRDPNLTCQKFLPDPDGGDKRIYLTGDLGRMRPDGCLEYLGRKDFQVKIRGYRVELVEIEAALCHLDAVKDAVVVAHAQDNEHKRLIAYIVPSRQSAPTVSELRQALATTLPEYMIPSTFVMLDALPLTPTRKVDRQALPAPDQTRPALDVDFVPPNSDMECQLIQIWEHVLEIHPIGIHDNFFDLGGNSILASKILTDIQDVFGQRLLMLHVFQSPTIAQLAETLLRHQSSPSFFSLIPIQAQGTLPPLFFVYPLGRALRYSVQGTSGLATYLGDNQPIYGLRYGLAQIQELDQLPLPPRRIEDLAAQYIQEIRQIQPEGPYFLCGRSGGGLIAFEMACQLRQQGYKIDLLVLLDALHPLRYRYCPNASTRRLKYALSTLFTNPDRGIIAQFRSLLYLYLTGTPRRYRRRWLELFLFARFVWQIQRLNFYVRHQMRYDPKVYSGRVTLFESAIQDGPCESRWGWEPFAAGGLEIITVPGHHGNMMEEDANLTAIAEALQTCLAEARKNLELNPTPPRESGVE